MENKIAQQIAAYVAVEVDSEIESTEENCGSMWITTVSGKTYSITVEECKAEDEESETEE